jgi:hypothetical protein
MKLCLFLVSGFWFLVSGCAWTRPKDRIDLAIEASIEAEILSDIPQ